ncbi:SRPBCC family protein [Streptomyces sp. NPDC004838]
MTVFRLTRAVTLPADEVWRQVTDWHAHAAQVPFTSLASLTPGPAREGTVFVVRSAVGRLGFDDPMEIVRWEPPDGDRSGKDRPGGDRPGGDRRGAENEGRCRLEKRGRVVLGWAEIEVVPQEGGSLVVWTEELRFRGLPRLLDQVTAKVGQLVFGRALDGLLRSGGPGPG